MTREEVNATHFFGVSLELRLLLGAALLGMLLGAAYDLFRALRLSFKHSPAAVFFEDFLFVLIFGLNFYIFSTALCRGEIRLFVVAGMLAGFFAYLATLGRIVSLIVAKAVGYVKKGIKRLCRLLKKIIGVLLGMPFFAENTDKFQENPCKDPSE